MTRIVISNKDLNEDLPEQPEGVLQDLGEMALVISPKAVAENARLHGFRSKANTMDADIPELLALIHSEISEGLEAYREDNIHGDAHSLANELADAVIRIFHLCYLFDIDLPKKIEQIHRKNLKRGYKHGNKRC